MIETSMVPDSDSDVEVAPATNTQQRAVALISEGGTSKSDTYIRHIGSSLSTNGEHHITYVEQRLIWMEASGANIPWINLRSTASRNIIYNNWVPGTPFVILGFNDITGTSTTLPNPTKMCEYVDVKNFISSTVSTIDWYYGWTGPSGTPSQPQPWKGVNRVITLIYVGRHTIASPFGDVCLFAKVCG